MNNFKSIYAILRVLAFVIFFFNASAQEMNKPEETSAHFESANYLCEMKETLGNTENLDECELAKTLSDKEINPVSLKKSGNEVSQAVTIFVTGCYHLKKFCKPPFGDCDYYWVDVCLEN